MDFKSEDFPLYELLLRNNEPGVAMARKDFEAAVNGDDAEKVSFALGIQTLAFDMQTGALSASNVPGNTDEINNKTIQSCLRVFQEAAACGNTTAQFMVQEYKSRGISF